MGTTISSIVNFIRNNIAGAIDAFIVTRANEGDAEEYGYAPPVIHSVCGYRSTYPLDALISVGFDVKAVNANVYTPLQFAIWHRLSPNIFNALIAGGADVNAQDNRGYTPLYVACINCVSTDYVKLLINAGADVNIPKNDGWTPLHAMCNNIEGSLETIKLILAAGANVNAQNTNGNTPLHGACLMEDMRIAQTLLDAGADPFIKNVEGRLPHEMTFIIEFKELFEQFRGGRATKAAIH